MKSFSTAFVLIFVATSFVFTGFQLAPLYYDAQNRLESKSSQTSSMPSIVLDRNGNKIGQFGRIKSDYIKLNGVSDPVKKSIIAAEDSDFYQHFGVSVRGILRAAWANLKSGQWVQGASTITQQLVRMKFLTPEKTIARKIKEIFAAFALERIESKDSILEQYLNSIYLGNGVLGVESAARNYFGKSARDLGWAESTLLAGIVKAPSRYNLRTAKGLELAKKRQQYVLNRLVDDKVLTDQEAANIYNYSVEFVASQDSIGPYPYAMFTVWHFLKRKYAHLDLPEGGFRIYTTFDEEYLKRFEQLDTNLAKVKWFEGKARQDQNQAMVMIDSQHGDLLAIKGGNDFHRNQYNHALQMKRPIGAMILPLITAKALAFGYKMQSPVNLNATIQKKDHSSIRLFDVLNERSVFEFTPVGIELGLGTISEYLKKIGMYAKRKDFSLLWGAEAFSLYELVQAYQILSAPGSFRDVQLIERIVDGDGQVVFDRSALEKNSLSLLDSRVAYSVNQAILVRQYLQKQNSKTLPYVYDSLDSSSQNAWQILWNQKLLVGVWWGSSSGGNRIDLSSETIRHNFYSSYRSIKEALSPLSQGSMSPPENVLYKPLTLDDKGEVVYLPEPLGLGKKTL